MQQKVMDADNNTAKLYLETATPNLIYVINKKKRSFTSVKKNNNFANPPKK